MKQNVTLVLNDCNREGAPIMSLRLRDCLLKRGRRVKVIAFTEGPLVRNVDAVISNPREAAKQCSDWDSDAVLLCTLLTMQHVQIFQSICEDAQIVGVCHEMYSDLFSWFDKAHFEAFDSLIFVSHSSKLSFEPISCDEGTVFVAPNWLDQNTIERIENIPDISIDLYNKIDVGAADKLLVIASSVVEHKGIEPFMSKVFAPVKSELKNLKIAILGEVYCPELRDRILTLCPDVFFAGSVPQNDFFNLLRLADVFVHCSESESFCLAIHEAMHAKIPILACRSGGAEEQLVHARDGYLFDFGDHVNARKYLKTLLREVDLANQFAVSAHQVAKSKFGETPSMQTYLEAIFPRER